MAVAVSLRGVLLGCCEWPSLAVHLAMCSKIGAQFLRFTCHVASCTLPSRVDQQKNCPSRPLERDCLSAFILEAEVYRIKISFSDFIGETYYSLIIDRLAMQAIEAVNRLASSGRDSSSPSHWYEPGKDFL